MTDWWTVPYPKHPDPPDVSLPRTLYPPKMGEGFFNGDDVTAYKRAVSRLGRWPWDPEGWDDGYADTFAYGTSGNVKDTGVKGIQRQSGLDQSAMLGPHTFEILRTAMIPYALAQGLLGPGRRRRPRLGPGVRRRQERARPRPHPHHRRTA